MVLDFYTCATVSDIRFGRAKLHAQASTQLSRAAEVSDVTSRSLAGLLS